MKLDVKDMEWDELDELLQVLQWSFEFMFTNTITDSIWSDFKF